MKIIKIIFFNILLAIFFLFVVEFVILNLTKDNNEKKIFNIYIPTYGDYRYPVSYLEQPRFLYRYRGEGKKQPIMLIGCSYAYGHGLRYKKTFAAKLSNTTKRDIYNLSEIGNGPVDILISLDYSKHFYDIKTPPEYVIYVYMYHHPNRIPFNFSKTNYMQNNGILLKENHSIFKKLYLYKNLRKQKLESITIKAKDEEWKYEYIKTSIIKMQEKLKKRYPKSKFAVLVYSDYERFLNQNILKYKGIIDSKDYDNCKDEETMGTTDYDILHSDKFWNEIREKGIIVIKTEDLIGRTMNKPEERLNPDFAITIHPSEYAWSELTPLISKELEKYRTIEINM